MGEYAKYPKNSDNEIKIGTCSSMYYLRYEQRNLIAPAISDEYIESLTFRLPIPEEDHNTPGDFEFYGFYGVDATKYQLFIDDENLAQELRECAAKTPGNVQLVKRDAGFVVNFPCGHGQELQDLPKGFSYNGFNSNTFALFGFGIRNGVPCVLVGCYICEKPICWITQDELEKCQVRPAGYKQYLLDYMKKAAAELAESKGGF